MDFTTKYEESFFTLCKKSPQLIHEDAPDIEYLEKLRESELEGQEVDLYCSKEDLKDEVRRYAKILIQKGAQERLVYLKSLLARTISTINEMERDKHLHDAYVYDPPRTRYQELRWDSGTQKELHLLAIKYLKEFENFLTAEIDGRPEIMDYRMKSEKGTHQKQKGNKSYSLRQVCIAYHFMGGVKKDNAQALLKAHTKYSNADKLLQKRVSKKSDLTLLSKNKTADTKHLNDLLAAKRLISGKKNPDALSRISDTITQFQTKYDDNY